jgi:hypothetical protein
VAPQPPSVIWKETPILHWGCVLPDSRDPCRLQSQGVGTRYSMGLGSLISLGSPEMSDHREQDSNPGGRRKGRFITLAGQHPGSFQKWHWPCSSGLRGFYASECRSKQVGRTKVDMAVSLSLGGYNIAY